MADNNTVKRVGPCRPDDYYSPANRVAANPRSLFQVQAQAQLRQNECCQGRRAGAPSSMDCYNPGDWQVCQRFHENWVERGAATHIKSEDGIY